MGRNPKKTTASSGTSEKGPEKSPENTPAQEKEPVVPAADKPVKADDPKAALSAKPAEKSAEKTPDKDKATESKAGTLPSSATKVPFDTPSVKEAASSVSSSGTADKPAAVGKIVEPVKGEKTKTDEKSSAKTSVSTATVSEAKQSEPSSAPPKKAALEKTGDEKSGSGKSGTGKSGGGGRVLTATCLVLMLIAIGVAAYAAYAALNNPVVAELRHRLDQYEAARATTQQAVEAVNARLEQAESLLKTLDDSESELREAFEGVKRAATSLGEGLPAAPDVSAAVQGIQDRIASLETGFGTLSQGFDSLIGAPETPSIEPSVFQALQDKQNELSGMVSSLRETLNGMEGAQSVSQSLAQNVVLFGKRLDDLQKQVEETRVQTRSSQAFLLAATQLNSTVERGDRFSVELKTVKDLAPSSINVAELTDPFAAYADKGIPTTEVLRTRFPAVADKALRASILPDGNKLLAGTLDSLASLVSIRRVDAGAEGESPQAVFARAEAHIEAGDLADAVREVSTLHGAPAESVQPWLADAKARLAAQENMSALAAQAIAFDAK